MTLSAASYRALSSRSGRFILQSRCNHRRTSDVVVLSRAFSSSSSNRMHDFSTAASLVNDGDNNNNIKYPELKHVRSFPFVGSLIPQLSGIPRNNLLTDSYNFWREMRKQYGDFYTFGSPAFGSKSDIYGPFHVVTDPKEMVQVIKAGGAHPSGIVENLWVSRKWNETRNIATKGLLERGEEWKRIRTFMQTDLLSPESAKGYVPGMILAAQHASRGAPSFDSNLNEYLGRCAFDLFSTIMFGELTKVADPTTETDPENERFVVNAAAGLGTSVEMLLRLDELVAGKLGITTKRCDFVFDAFDVCWEIAQQKFGSFLERKAARQLTENEQNSYLFRALERQQDPSSNVTVEEVKELAFTGLFAAVDTTSSVLGWCLFHMAANVDVQQKLHQELAQAVEKVGKDGKLTPEAVDRKHAPYLHAFIREQHRMSPTGSIFVSKTIARDGINVNGVSMKSGDVVGLEGYSTGMDPAIVEDPDEFRPERWLPDAVDARKGTPKEVMDHPFMKDPFSQGARKCPGSRVATNEVQVLLAQLVLDWKISSPATGMADAKYSQRTTLEVELPKMKFEAR